MRYVFFDTETSGSHVRYDQILQYAAVVTDGDFNEIEAVDIRSARLPFIVPHPKALEVTHITPQMLEQADYSAYEFARHIHQKLSQWGPAIFTGQNILRFDREIMRSMFYMNLLDPYLMGAKGSQELDILPVMRFIHTIDPTAMNVPVNPETGRFVFKLEKIAPLNGFVSNGNAHDALVDVRATVYMAKLLRDRRPELFALAVSCADPKRNLALLREQRCVKLLTYFGEPKVLEITHVAAHPTNKNQSACFNLAHDPRPWMEASVEHLAQHLYGAETPFQVIKANHQPMVMPLDVEPLPAYDPIDRDVLVRRLEMIHQSPVFAQKVADAMAKNAESFTKGTNIEDTIYDGFSSWADNDRKKQWHDRTWIERYQMLSSFEDKRLKQIGLRLIFNDAPHVLDAHFASKIEQKVLQERVLSEKDDVPWTTLAKAEAGLNDVEDPVMKAEIADWLAQFRAKAQARLDTLSS